MPGRCIDSTMLAFSQGKLRVVFLHRVLTIALFLVCFSVSFHDNVFVTFTFTLPFLLMPRDE